MKTRNGLVVVAISEVAITMLNSGNVIENALFSRGFAIFLSEEILKRRVLGLVGNWTGMTIGSYEVFFHPETRFVHASFDGGGVLLIGNAVNPFSGGLESGIVQDISKLIKCDAGNIYLNDVVFDYFDQLTGRFQVFIVFGEKLIALSDATGLAPIYFYSGKRVFFSSHAQLVGEALGLERDPNMDRIIESPFFKVGRRYLPGHCSVFKDVEILGANVFYCTERKKRVRFFPREPITSYSSEKELIKDSADILRDSANLLSKSFDPLVSLSMGQDSRIGLSAFYGSRKMIQAYSYCGNPTETAEAYRVHQFARTIGVPHHVVTIDNINVHDYEYFVRDLDRSTGYMRKHKPSELSKIVSLSQWFPPRGIEIKGEASEISRATYAKRTGIKKFPTMSPRVMSNLYKRILFPRDLLKTVDHCFEEFIDSCNFYFSELGYDDYDMFFWEHRNACCVSLGMQDHDVYHEATALMNNRRLLTNFLTPPFQDRLADKMHIRVCEALWPSIMRQPASQRTSLHARVKVFSERVFFHANRALP